MPDPTTPDHDHDTGMAYRVAPPVDDAFMPWVTILEQRPAPGDLRWEFGPDDVLLPVRHLAVGDGVRTKVRERLANRSYRPAHLLRRSGPRSVARLP